MKKLLLAIMLVIAGIGMVACDITQDKPKEDDDIVEVIPGEDDNKEEETPKEEEDKEDEKPEIVNEDKIDYDGVLFFGNDFAQKVSQRAIINVEGYDEIRISIVGNSVFDIPLNMNNWEVDGVKVSHTGVTETSYYTKHQFLIGEVNAVGNLINNFTENGDLRLHTQHKDKGSNGYIKVDTTNVDEFAFDFKVTTGAFAFIESIRVDFLNTAEKGTEDENLPLIPLEPSVPNEKIEAPIVISEVYTRGGDKDSHYGDDYLVLYNITEEDIELNDFIIQQSSSDNFSFSKSEEDIKRLSGTIKGKSYFFIKTKGGTAETSKKNSFDVEFDLYIDISISATADIVLTKTEIEGSVIDNMNTIYLHLKVGKVSDPNTAWMLDAEGNFVIKKLV